MTVSENSVADVGFVACIEPGTLEEQAILLFESIRRYTGCVRNSPIYALSPRVGPPISREARRTLGELDVIYVDEVLNTECTYYGSANRVAAAAYVEDRTSHELLVVLDSDTLFLREPDEMLLPKDLDVAVRPVDLRGMCVSEADDEFHTYWRDLCRCCAVDYGAIPWTRSSVDLQWIKASYNAGLVVVRRDRGIMRRWADFFFRSVREQLKPYRAPRRFRAGAGWVNGETSTMWGSNQAALSLAIWSTTTRVIELPPTYNYPLHLHRQIDPATTEPVFPNLIHVHYHWLLQDKPEDNPLFDKNGPLSQEQSHWLLASSP